LGKTDEIRRNPPARWPIPACFVILLFRFLTGIVLEESPPAAVDRRFRNAGQRLCAAIEMSA
jgi:hypothetical protein